MSSVKNMTLHSVHSASAMREADARLDILSHRGSWVTQGKWIDHPYDIETGARPFPASAPRSLATLPNVATAAHAAFTLPAKQSRVVHLIGAMGVVLGDSIVGLTALHALRRMHPSLELTVYRPASAPDYVEQLYAIAAFSAFTALRRLPWSVTDIADDELIVDIGNFAYWPSFATTPMIDFFLRAIGVDPSFVPAADKANRWLATLNLPTLHSAWADRPYVLFSPDASTPIRRIPASLHHQWIDRLWETYRLPVVGFTAIDHPRYVNVAPLSPDTPTFLRWIRGASALVTADSAAVHAAAGFDVPTTAIFTTIDPALRVRDYAHCRAVDFRIDALNGMHSSDEPEHVALVEQAWRDADLDAMPLPVPSVASAPAGDVLAGT